MTCHKLLLVTQTSGALVAQAGCILQKLDDHVAPHGFLMPLVSLCVVEERKAVCICKQRHYSVTQSAFV